jgi:hypothetical protein
MTPKRYSVFDAEGRSIARYSDDVHTTEQIPESAIVIDERTFQELANDRFNCKRYVNGEVVINMERQSEMLAAHAASAAARDV